MRRRASWALALVSWVWPTLAWGQAAPAAVSSWELTAGVHESWDDNPRFRDPSAPASLVTGLGGSIRRTLVSPRGEFALFASGNARRYSNVSNLDRFTYEGTLTGTRRLSPRTDLRIGGSFTSDYATNSRVLDDTGVLVPQTLVHRGHGLVSLTHELTSKTFARAETAYTRIDFDSETLLDGSEVTASLALGRRLGPAESISFSYAFLDNRLPGREKTTQSLSGAWNGPLGRHWTATASLGLTYYQPEAGDHTLTPLAGAGASARYGRTTFDVRYNRRVSQAFGFGRQRLGDFVTTAARRVLVRGVALSAYYAYGLSRIPSDETFRITSHNYGAALAWEATRNLVAAASWSHRHQDEVVPVRSPSEDVWRVSLAYVRQWR